MTITEHKARDGQAVGWLAQYQARVRVLIDSISKEGRYDGDFLHPVFGDGGMNSAVVLIGEAPGAEEAVAGRPFVGKAGAQLDALLLLAGIPRESVYITNVVKYRPVVRSERSVRNRTPSKREIDAFLPLLAEELLQMRPVLIATLGNTPLSAVQALCGLPAEPIGALHGRCTGGTLSGMRTTLYPMYHPASGIYNRSLIPMMEADAANLGEHLVKADA